MYCASDSRHGSIHGADRLSVTTEEADNGTKEQGSPPKKQRLTQDKGLQLRLELGNVVTGEGERGESGSWRLDG